MVPVAQETPLTPCVCPTVSAVGLAWWHVRSVAGDPPCASVVALCFAGLQRGLNAPFTLRQIDEAEFDSD